MKKINLLYSIFILLVVSNHSFGGSIAGGHISYQALGNNQYLVTYNMIRDCSGSMAPLNLPLNVNSNSCSYSQTFTLLPVPSNPGLINLCASQPNTCNGGTSFGAQVWEYNTVVTLPSQCIDWIFSVEDSSRADSITTIQPGQNFYVEAALNNVGQDNSSPSFSIYDISVGCINQLSFYSQGAIDIDGDSLVFSFVNLRSNNNTPVIYNSGFTGMNPLTSNPPASIDPATGNITLNSSIQEFAEIGVRVEEYRNGIAIGYTDRNIAMISMTCATNTPELYPSFPSAIYIEAQQQFCITFTTHDLDPNDTITMTRNLSDFPGATLPVTGTPFPTGTFCWTPADSDTTTSPHVLTITLRDKDCPVPNQVSFVFYIYVTPFTGIDNPNRNNSVYLFEDKLSERFLINSGNLFVERVKVYSSTGETLIDEKDVSGFGSEKLTPGIYVVELKIKDKTFIRKLIK